MSIMCIVSRFSLNLVNVSENTNLLFVFQHFCFSRLKKYRLHLAVANVRHEDLSHYCSIACSVSVKKMPTELHCAHPSNIVVIFLTCHVQSSDFIS